VGRTQDHCYQQTLPHGETKHNTSLEITRTFSKGNGQVPVSKSRVVPFRFLFSIFVPPVSFHRFGIQPRIRGFAFSCSASEDKAEGSERKEYETTLAQHESVTEFGVFSGSYLEVFLKHFVSFSCMRAWHWGFLI
jgi:hypothetical protein